MRITRFSDLGEKYKCYHLNGYIEPRIISTLNNNKFIFYYFHSNSYVPKEEDNLLHIYSKDFKLIESFAPAGEVYNFKESFLVQIIHLDELASMYVIDSTKVLFVPGFYDGIIYMYENINSMWMLKKLYGKKFFDKPYKLLNPNKFDSRNHVPYTNYRQGAMGKFYYKELCGNLGIISVNDSTIAHFSFRVSRKNKYFLNIELFKLTGEFIGYASGDDIQITPNNSNLFIGGVFCSDDDGNVYGEANISNNGDIAVIKFEFKYMY